MVEIMTGILGGSAFMTDIPSWLFCMPKPNQVSHTFICMDPSKFGELDEFKARVDEAIDRLHSAPLAVGCDHIYYPGRSSGASGRTRKKMESEFPRM
jgi:ureidoglycolate dehydrogenase (NAD+)